MERSDLAGRLRVLMLEDVAGDAELAAHELRRAGYDIELHRVFAERELVDALEESWDVVLADYRLPQMVGLDAIRIVRERRPVLPVIMFTGTAPKGAREACIRAGAAAFLTKDELSALASTVGEVIAKPGKAADETSPDHGGGG